MKKMEIRTRQVNTIVEVICNRCGNSCGTMTPASELPEFHGLIEVHVDGTYFSPHLADLMRYRFSICEKCLTELFSTFKIQPEMFEIDIWDRRLHNGIPVIGDD